MADVVFKAASDLAEYANELQGFHQPRIQQLMALQYAWESPIRTTETGRTIYINNEPWTATRLTVALLTNGRLFFKGYMPPDAGDTKQRNAAISQIERALKAHFRHTDLEFYRRRRNTFLRQWGYSAAVYGWHSGINLVLDSQSKWPVYTDIWNPIDVFPDMDSSALVHIQYLTAKEIEKRFGPKALRVGQTGYNFKDDKDGRWVKYLTYDFWDEDTNASAVQGATDIYWVKKQMEHKLGHNPAWCNPIDGPPFRSSASDRNGKPLASPDSESGRWLEFAGQSPLIGYRTAYQYLSELANQIADVVERWANPVVLAKTVDNKYVELDMSGAKQNTVDLSTVVEVIKPPTFPNDDKAWLEFVLRDIEKASYPRAAYGAVGSTEAAYTIQLMKAASGYIIDPIVQQAEFMYEAGAESILTQLQRRKAQYSKFFHVKSINKVGRRIVDYIKLDDLPDNVQVTAEIRGAGVPTDKFQALAAVAQVSQLTNPPLSLETLLDDYLESDDPSGEVARIVMQKLTMNDEVYAKASPIATLGDLADRLRSKGTPRANDLADAMSALSIAAMHELRNLIQQSIQAPDVERSAAREASGLPPVAQPGPGLPPEGQIVGVAPIGAPPAGSTLPPTGPQPLRGAQMQAALAAQGGSLGGPGGSPPPPRFSR